MSGAGVFVYGGSHERYMSGAGNQDILAEQVKREGGVNRISEGIKAGKNIQWNLWVGQPDICFGNRNELAKRSRSIDPDHTCPVAKVSAPCETIPASPANDMPLACHDHARLEINDVTSHGF